MHKVADINTMLDTIRSRVKDTGTGLSDWYGQLNPEIKNTALRGLVGAGIGAATVGGLSAGMPNRGIGTVMSPAILGALLGGGAAAGLPLGAKMLTNNMAFGSEQKKPAAGVGADMLIGSGLKHPAMLGAGAATMVPNKNRNAWSQFHSTFKATPKGTSLAERIKASIGTMGERANLADQLKDTSGKDVADAGAKAAREAAVDAAKAEGAKLGLEGEKLTAHITDAIKNLGPAGEDLATRAAKAGVKGTMHVHPGRLAAVPAALGAGWLADKYLRGEY